MVRKHKFMPYISFVCFEGHKLETSTKQAKSANDSKVLKMFLNN